MGVEYNLRKIRALDSITEERVSVFKLNYSELQCIHNEYGVILEDFNYKNIVDYKHEYEYSDRYGVLLFIILIDKKGKRTKVPVTMLSLFEGHAFSNEEIRKVKDISLIIDETVKKKFISEIEQDYESYINDPKNHEYNILLMLTTIHMEKLGLNRKQIISFFSAMAGFVFNISSSGLSILVNRVFEFINSQYKYCVKADLCRNQLRHILAFQSIVKTYDYINHPYNKSKKRYLLSF